ncbi:MAG: RNA methyltransferase, partial [Roseiarcus sp.]
MGARAHEADALAAVFGDCGGCAAQHMSAALYGEWKRESVVRARERARGEAEVGALIDPHGEGRRRATIHPRNAEDGPERVGVIRARA